VLARRKEEPTQVIEEEALSSTPMTGAAVETDVESRKERKRARCRPKNWRNGQRKRRSQHTMAKRNGKAGTRPS
jgi:hypothetical protein